MAALKPNTLEDRAAMRSLLVYGFCENAPSCGSRILSSGYPMPMRKVPNDSIAI